MSFSARPTVSTYDGGVGGSSTANRGTASYTYNPQTGKWVPNAPSIGEAPSATTDEIEKVPSNITGEDETSQVDSKTQSDREYIDIELKTLVGEAVVVPSQKNIRIKVNTTIKISGIGKYLSGKYFVSSVKRTLSKDGGYSQTVNVLKNGFGDSLKQASGSSSSPAYSYDMSSAPSAKLKDYAPEGAVDRKDLIDKSAP